jgi:tetratricopeptide (TPR) repeat protein
MAVKPSHRAAAAIAICGTAAALAAAVAIWSHRHPGGTGTRPPESRVVAIVTLQSLSQNDKDQWLAPALTEMLGTELSAADEIRVIPNARVLEAIVGLKVQQAGGYGPDALAQLRRRLDADFVITGQYRLTDAAADSPLSVIIALQDAHTGASIAVLSNQGSLSSLNQLVNQTGAAVRKKLGTSNASQGRLHEIANIQPPTTAVAQRIGFALDAIARHDSARARDELLEAVAEAPDYTPSYLYLSQAWSALGYRQKALAAAKQAVTRASSVPPELRMQIEAAVQMESYDAKSAAASWRKLVALRPSTLEYRLELISAEISAGDTESAQTALVELRGLRQASEDPRVELAATELAAARNDSQSQLQHAQEALQQAQAHETLGLVADAQVALASAQMYLGQLDSSKSALDTAIADYHEMGNPRGEVAARRLRATVLDSQLHHQPALEEYQHTIALAESIGDAGEVGAIYRNICSMLWMQGDREGAQASARRALEISRITGDLRLQIWTLRALATIASDEADTDDVLSKYREVTALTESSHDPGGHVWSLATYADTLRMMGQLDEAQTSCAAAQTEADLLSDPQFKIYSGFTCASVAVDRGEPETALLLLEKIELLSRRSGNTVYQANSEFLMGQIEFDAGRWAKAQEHSRLALKGYSAADAHTGEANAEALLALCAQMLKQPAERDQAATRARELRTTISSRQEIYLVDIALAKLADGNQRGAAVNKLRELAGDAERRRWIGWSLESKLAEWQILTSEGDKPDSSQTRVELEKTARAHGFKRILSLLNSSRPTTQ